MLRKTYAPDPKRLGAAPRLCMLLYCLANAVACTSLEPRWLLQALPGEYPDVVYYVPTEQPVVALTIDDGPDATVTADILDLLAAHGARATFFVLTDNVPGNEHLLHRMVNEGHELGNHLTADEVSVDLPAADFAAKLEESSATLADYGPVRWFRPGSGWYNERMLAQIKIHGYRLAEASMLPLDARLPSPRVIAGYVNASVRPGSIIVLHTNRGRGHRTLAALQRILPTLNQRGYRVSTLSEVDDLYAPPSD